MSRRRHRSPEYLAVKTCVGPAAREEHEGAGSMFAMTLGALQERWRAPTTFCVLDGDDPPDVGVRRTTDVCSLHGI